jgi:hypothetical protein
MNELSFFGKMLIGAGILLVIAGIIFVAGTKFLSFGRLPGDIFFQKGNFTFSFPIMTGIIISIILTIILNLLFIRR